MALGMSPVHAYCSANPMKRTEPCIKHLGGRNTQTIMGLEGEGSDGPHGYRWDGQIDLGSCHLVRIAKIRIFTKTLFG